MVIGNEIDLKCLNINMNKISFIAIFGFFSAAIYGDQTLDRQAQKFNVPRFLLGSYWTAEPLDITREGTSYGVGFNMIGSPNGYGQTSSEIIWVRKGTIAPIEIKTIASINTLLSYEFANREAFSGREEQYYKSQISLVTNCVAIHIVPHGPSGFSLLPQSAARIVSRLESLGLAPASVKLLRQLSNDCIQALDLKAKSWTAAWYQVDQFGAIEKMTIRGTTASGSGSAGKLITLKSITNESVYDAGTIDPAMLLMRNFIDGMFA